VEKFVEKKARTTAAAVTRKGKTVKRAVRAAKKKAEAEAEE